MSHFLKKTKKTASPQQPPIAWVPCTLLAMLSAPCPVPSLWVGGHSLRSGPVLILQLTVFSAPASIFLEGANKMILVLWLFPPPVEILLAKSLQLCLDSLRPCGLQPTRLLKAPLSMGFSRQEYWSGLPCPLPGDLPSPVIEPPSLRSPALAGGFFTTRATS